MHRQTFRCEAVNLPVARRNILLGMATLAALVPIRARAADGQAKIADLVDADGNASPWAVANSGAKIVLRGYFAPALTDVKFDLYEAPAAPCQLCGMIHDAGANIEVEARVPADANMMKMIEVAGRIEAAVDRAPRIIAAEAATV
ncbi:hypothetical protein PY365_14075 [Roseiarcaceae bacterium H3SJ34-1]|uniref:hypothetical protein n=1 Tax=Terripilifer ovatus TaxID=3032367 RepID=UPI003AB9A4F0|nr:hypothetical protein [Roseiarcaceae bacterium H3SJ34-1]